MVYASADMFVGKAESSAYPDDIADPANVVLHADFDH